MVNGNDEQHSADLRRRPYDQTDDKRLQSTSAIDFYRDINGFMGTSPLGGG